jgi:hypothetical protein
MTLAVHRLAFTVRRLGFKWLRGVDGERLDTSRNAERWAATPNDERQTVNGERCER